MFDVETLIDGLTALLKAKLNTKIAAIDAEKADSVTLDQVNAAAYTDFGINDAVLNYNPFVILSESDIKTDPIGSGTALEVEIMAAIVIGDTGNDDNTGKRVRRYSRALKEVIEEDFKFQGTVELRINSVTPESYRLKDERIHHFAGVMINAHFA